MAEQTNIFGMLNAEDKLDGTKCPTWAYMMRLVLVAKQLWDIVIGSDERPTSSSSPNSPSPSSTQLMQKMLQDPLNDPLLHNLTRMVRMARAHLLVALSIKHHIVPHIRSCTTSKNA